MNTTTYTQNSAAYLAVAAFLIAFALLTPSSAHAATCTFVSNLELGTETEAVRCLQKYLNASGFTVSTSGVGAPGFETNQYREKTRAAVQKWQVANGISPATGTFGPISRAKYIVLTSAAPAPAPAPTPTPTPVPTTPTPAPASSASMTAARDAILDARDEYEDALAEYEDVRADKGKLGQSKVLLVTAQEHLLDALYAFVEGSYTQAQTYARDAAGAVEDAFDELGGGSTSKDVSRTEAKDVLSDVRSALKDAEDDIDDSRATSKKKDTAYDLLDKAEKDINRALRAYGFGDYDEAVDYAEKADVSIRNALKAIK